MTRAEALQRLRSCESDLRQLGIERLSLFGSTARGEERPESDVDVAVELKQDAHIGAFAFIALERRVAAILGERVDLVAEPHDEAPRLQAEIDRDRVHVF
ncbi:nucleotidyltransferase domain-containing protein [uncultured Sphingomonas sp.]|uniref:nucleotidyltransferase family protein n=1 Tax=uncultured Sphingomonas sp. TaxID=158754 RepID=UPI0025D29B59|nr:nucleotidyltransferase domain-containing protein [uncultured Sphingomonas sp.]